MSQYGDSDLIGAWPGATGIPASSCGCERADRPSVAVSALVLIHLCFFQLPNEAQAWSCHARARWLVKMDLSNFLKGASNTMKSLDADASSKANERGNAGWTSWAGEDDAWEDVADVLPSRIQSSPEKVVSKGEQDQTRPDDNKTLPVQDVDDNKKGQLLNDSTDGRSEKESESLQVTRNKLSEALQRAAAAERKLYIVTRERDNMRRSSDQQVSRTADLQAKERQIQAILQEGEKLSIRVAEKEAAARALKRDLKDRDAHIEELRAIVATNEAKLKNALQRQSQLEESEKASRDALSAQEERLARAENDARTSSSNSAALDAVRTELETLRRNQASSLEEQASKLKAEHETYIGTIAAKSKMTEDAMNKAMIELQAHLTKVIQDSGQREDELRYEVGESRRLAEELKARNEELVAAIPNATRPLVRQVEALQAAALERNRTKSAVERSQSEQLRAAEAALDASQNRERVASDQIRDLQGRVMTLESQIKAARAEQTRAVSELDTVRQSFDKLELEHKHEMEENKKQLRKIIKAKEAAEHELSRDRVAHITALESVGKREESLRDQLSSLESQLYSTPKRASDTQTSSKRQSTGSLNGSRSIQVSNSAENISSPNFSFDNSESADFLSEPHSSGVLYAMDQLKLSLRKRDGEVAALQSRLKRKETATETLAEDVVKLTGEVETLKKDRGDTPALRAELAELQKRHTALLELLGEREERITELDADLADVKQMYKEQITELLLKLEEAAR
ncbi:TATA element modulatory factor 1 TATA binding [Gracilaria domingensis]|nr:TATA element modulatory factor 1 TATA binding [Gracilaria domingensis]